MDPTNPSTTTKKSKRTRSRDKETAAIAALTKALEPLDPQARSRVMDYVIKRLDHHVTIPQ